MGALSLPGASLLLGEHPTVNPPFGPPGAQKTPETARFGPSAGKTNKRPGYDPFFAENPFSPADEFVFMGVVVRSCHFDVTACAEAGQLAQRPERSLRDLSARSRMNSQSNQKFTAQSNICSQMEYIALLIYIVSVSSFGATVCSVNC